MILTIIIVIVTVIGIVMLNKSEYDGIAYGLGLLFTVAGGLVAFIMVICIICDHVGEDVHKEENRIA